MKYDFENLLDRRGHDAIAIDAIGDPKWAGMAPAAPKEGFDPIPMWVADMNFPTAQSIIDAVIARASHPAFGYFADSDEYFSAIAWWHRLRKGVDDISREVITYENGVLGGLVSALKVFAAPGDSVLLHSPTYVGFTGTLTANGYHIVHSPLIRDAEGTWRMDYEDMDRKIREKNIHAVIFCNPHNPTGRVWTQEEVAAAMKVYERNDCAVISDEIWSDLMMNGHAYTPAQSVSPWAKDHVVALYAPSKTFNLAGLIGSYSIIYNPMIRKRVKAIGDKTHYNEMNVLSQHALIGAYSGEGNNWLSQLLPVLSENVNLAYDFVTNRLPGVSVFRTEGTYMMLLDLHDYLQKSGLSQKEVLKKGWDYGIGWQDGHQFEAPESIRLNLASPTARIREAFERMEKYVFI